MHPAADDLALFYADGDPVFRADGSQFRAYFNVTDAQAFEGVKVGEYALQHPTAVGLARGETLTLPTQGLTLRVADVNRIGDGLESLAELVSQG